MQKKMDRGEPKKECPSCGLGVSLEARICEFCGWDFEEEDEWILQIEKLERDLLLEKQKFQPGSVNHKIESTLRNPVQEKAEAEQVAARAAQAEEAESPKVVLASEYMLDRETPAQTLVPEEPVREPEPVVVVRQPAPAPEPVRQEPDAPKIRKVRSVRPPEPAPAPPPQPVARPQPAAPAQPLRKVKPPAPAPPQPVQTEQPTRKVRTVRKVKG